MNKRYFLIVLCLFFNVTIVLPEYHRAYDQSVIYSYDKIIFVGNILFPQTVKTIPQLSLYRGGIQIKTQSDNASKKIQFTISEEKNCNVFYLLITDNVQPFIQDDTIQFLKIDPEQAYKFYKLELIQSKTEQTVGQNGEKNIIKKPTTWKVLAGKIQGCGRIPDETLIVIANPNFVEKIEGGSQLELPKIIMKQNLLEIAGGSEEKLHDQEAELLLASLDLNLFHTKMVPAIKQDIEKKLIIAMANPT